MRLAILLLDCWLGWAAGMLIAAIHAVACIRYSADQVVTGTAHQYPDDRRAGFPKWRHFPFVRLDSADSQGALDPLDAHL